MCIRDACDKCTLMCVRRQTACTYWGGEGMNEIAKESQLKVLEADYSEGRNWPRAGNDRSPRFPLFCVSDPQEPLGTNLSSVAQDAQLRWDSVRTLLSRRLGSAWAIAPGW